MKKILFIIIFIALVLIPLTLMAAGLSMSGLGPIVAEEGGGGGGADYQVKYGYIYTDGYAPYASNQFEIAIYNSSYELIGTSAAVAQGSSAGWVRVEFTSGPTLTAGNTYYLKILVNGTNYVNVYCSTDTWKVLATTDTWPDANATIAPGSDTGLNRGLLGVYVANAAETKLCGDNSTTGKTNTAPVGLSGNGYYMEDGYTADTL